MFVYDHEEILIQNIKLVKMMCGDPSDNIAGIKSLGVRRLIALVPEIKTQPLTLENLKDKFNILFEQDRDNNLIKNLITGVTKHGVLGEEFYNVNKRIVSLDEPFLTEESIVSINSLMTDIMDPEGRSYKNTMKMMMEDGIFLLLPKSDDSWINFLNPFLRLTRKEKNKKLIKIKNND
jgi:5'-3' exonuclease